MKEEQQFEIQRLVSIMDEYNISVEAGKKLIEWRRDCVVSAVDSFANRIADVFKPEEEKEDE
jgi:hypothetical protein